MRSRAESFSFFRNRFYLLEIALQYLFLLRSWGFFGKRVDEIGDGRGVVLLSWGVFREGFKTWFSPLLHK